jgi:glycosyltransferase involved in cell wall biosynthesis
MHRLAIVITHPIQYHAPLYKHLAADGRFELKVFFLSDRGARPYYEKFAKKVIQYDNPILEGYAHTFMKQGTPKSWWQKRTEFVNFQLPQQLREFAPDGIYLHGYENPSILWSMVMCRLWGIPLLLRGENEDLIPRPLWKRLVRETYLLWILRQFDAFLYIGTYNKRFYLKRGIPEKKLFSVPYSVDNGYFMPGSPAELERIREKVRSKYGVDAATRLFIYTHKLRQTMKPLDAVQAYCLLPETALRGSALIMCGDGELREQCEEIARGKKGAKIFFTGYISQAELKEHMLASDVMINPAQEPWGCSTNEGLASGLAMISSDQVAGWPDMVTEANGFVYRCGDVRGLSELIRKMAELPGERIGRMKEESLGISRKLSFGACADGLAAAMEAVAKERGK